MTYTCLTVSQVSPARGMTMVMSARKELTWRKNKASRLPVPNKDIKRVLPCKWR